MVDNADANTGHITALLAIVAVRLEPSSRGTDPAQAASSKQGTTQKKALSAAAAALQARRQAAAEEARAAAHRVLQWLPSKLEEILEEKMP